MAGGMAVGLGATLKPVRGQQTSSGPTSELPSKFTPSAHSIPHSNYSPFTTPDYYTFADDLVIERNLPNKPHQGKVLAAVQAHSDDIPLFAAGTVAKLIDEGYTGYLIRLSNDEAAGTTLGSRRGAKRSRHPGSGQGHGAQEDLLLLLPEPSHGRQRGHRNPGAADFPVPHAAGEYGLCHGSV